MCAGTRFEGMLWGEIQPDGWNATEVLCKMLIQSKFLPQLHVILLDGISMGGLNIVDFLLLAKQLKTPCVAVMRKQPDLRAIEQAMQRVSEPQQRLEIIRRAGDIYEHPPFYFQVSGANSTARSLKYLGV